MVNLLFQKRFTVFKSQEWLISCFKTVLLYSEVREINILVSKLICCIQKSDKLIASFKTDLLYSAVRNG